MNIHDQVLSFIQRRFPEDCHWTDGNCFWFAHILLRRFWMYDPVLMYNPTVNHFVVKIGEQCYDHSGVYDPGEDQLRIWEEYSMEDALESGRIIHDCVM